MQDAWNIVLFVHKCMTVKKYFPSTHATVQLLLYIKWITPNKYSKLYLKELLNKKEPTSYSPHLNIIIVSSNVFRFRWIFPSSMVIKTDLGQYTATKWYVQKKW